MTELLPVVGVIACGMSCIKNYNVSHVHVIACASIWDEIRI